MNISSVLDQLLKSGQGTGQDSRGLSNNSNSPLGGLGELLQSSGLGNMLSGFGGGVVTGGALGLLLGNKKARKVGGKVAMYSGLAALGVLAYKAYSNWQSKSPQTTAPGEPQTIDRLPAPEVEQHSKAILKALIAASKADGHVDIRERQLLDQELNKLTNDAQISRWFESELNKPLDPADIANEAKTPEMAAEMYLASVLMVDDENFMERSYLEELARQLKIDPALKNELEAQVRQELSRR